MLFTVGYSSSSGRSSQHTVLQTDASSRLSTAVFASGVNSAASSSHRTSLAVAGSQASSRLGKLSYAATNASEGSRTGQLPSAHQDTRAGRFHDAPSGRDRAGQALAGPADLAAVSHADGGKTGQAIPLGGKILEPHAVQQKNTACSSVYGANSQPEVAGLSQLQPPLAAPMTQAAADVTAAVAPSMSQEPIRNGTEVQDQQQTQLASAAMAQPPRHANAESGKSASGVILSQLSSAGHQSHHSDIVSTSESDAAGVSGQNCPAPEHPAAALGQQSQSGASSLQAPLAPEETALPGPAYAVTLGQPEAAPGTSLGMSQAEQRVVEEQEVLYNMTGQTGSLMYMAPEVNLLSQA